MNNLCLQLYRSHKTHCQVFMQADFFAHLLLYEQFPRQSVIDSQIYIHIYKLYNHFCDHNFLIKFIGRLKIRATRHKVNTISKLDN